MIMRGRAHVCIAPLSRWWGGVVSCVRRAVSRVCAVRRPGLSVLWWRPACPVWAGAQARAHRETRMLPVLNQTFVIHTTVVVRPKQSSEALTYTHYLLSTLCVYVHGLSGARTL